MSNESQAVAVEQEDTSGRLMGILSIAAAPGAMLVSPTLFSLLSFFLALMGLTLAAPKQRVFSFIGMAAAVICGGIGHFYHTVLF